MLHQGLGHRWSWQEKKMLRCPKLNCRGQRVRATNQLVNAAGQPKKDPQCLGVCWCCELACRRVLVPHHPTTPCTAGSIRPAACTNPRSRFPPHRLCSCFTTAPLHSVPPTLSAANENPFRAALFFFPNITCKSAG